MDMDSNQTCQDHLQVDSAKSAPERRIRFSRDQLLSLRPSRATEAEVGADRVGHGPAISSPPGVPSSAQARTGTPDSPAAVTASGRQNQVVSSLVPIAVPREEAPIVAHYQEQDGDVHSSPSGSTVAESGSEGDTHGAGSTASDEAEQGCTTSSSGGPPAATPAGAPTGTASATPPSNEPPMNYAAANALLRQCYQERQLRATLRRSFFRYRSKCHPVLELPSQEIGTQLWEAGTRTMLDFVLGRELEQKKDSTLTTTVIELGCGVGIVGRVLAQEAGLTVKQVYLTDLPKVLHLTKRNVEVGLRIDHHDGDDASLSAAVLPPQDECLDGDFEMRLRGISDPTRISVRPLVWGGVTMTGATCTADAEPNANGLATLLEELDRSPPGLQRALILGSECVYNSLDVVPLLETLHCLVAFCRRKEWLPDVVLSLGVRREAEPVFRSEAKARGWEVIEHFPCPLPEKSAYEMQSTSCSSSPTPSEYRSAEEEKELDKAAPRLAGTPAETGKAGLNYPKILELRLKPWGRGVGFETAVGFETQELLQGHSVQTTETT